MNPLKELKKFGQVAWLDYIRRSLITSGELKRMLDEDGLTGITINPTIFENAIAGSDDYDEALSELLKDDPHMDSRALYEKLAVEDVQMAADILRPIYEQTNGTDGFVSLELSPSLANDTEGSIKEARHFWKLVDRPNLLIKVPATSEGIPAIEALISEGINVNITLMFSLYHYEAVANAYLKGLEQCSDPARVASVASFFVSRVDTIVDKALEEIGSPEALELRGKIAVANAKMTYKRFKEVFSGERWERLAQRGARVQRPLWASTGTKNPAYSDVLYVEELIGQDTVNTLPPATINAFLDHGQVRPALEEGLDEAEATLKRLAELGVDLNVLTEKLQVDGLASFAASFDTLVEALSEKCQEIMSEQVDRQTLNLGEFQGQVEGLLKKWEEMNLCRRLWAKDPTLWFSKPMPEITDRLGWLFLPETMHEQIDDLVSFAEKVRADGIKHVVLLGMGGSSLAPEVYQSTFGNKSDYPELLVLDSTHPSAVRTIEDRIDLRHTLFLVSSKSGTTLETLSFFRYFWQKMSSVASEPGNHFTAVTDPDTPLMKLASEKGFRRIFLAPPDLGGRYSALTVFGLVPAALIGMDVHKLLDRAWVASESCAFCASEQKTSSLALGAALGVLAKNGRDKVTFFTSPSLRSFPDWLEQLIAESTGKDSKGIVPIVGEPLEAPEVYGKDRFFIYLYLEGDDDHKTAAGLKMLEENGHPTVRIRLKSKEDLGQEIFRWEAAVAAAGAVLEIHPFNQPDVQLAKELARTVMEEGVKVSQGAGDVDIVSIEEPEKLADALRKWLELANENDYAAIQAYLPPNHNTTAALRKIRQELLDGFKLATTLGYGPRFLHSTGQLHKGGPNSGLFLQIIDDVEEDLAIPETDYSFGGLIKAQALGDYQALKQRERRVLRINLKKEGANGLSKMAELLYDKVWMEG